MYGPLLGVSNRAVTVMICIGLSSTKILLCLSKQILVCDMPSYFFLPPSFSCLPKWSAPNRGSWMEDILWSISPNDWDIGFDQCTIFQFLWSLHINFFDVHVFTHNAPFYKFFCIPFISCLSLSLPFLIF